MMPRKVIQASGPGALARCLPECNAPLVLSTSLRTVLIRCGHCGRIREFHPVLTDDS